MLPSTFLGYITWQNVVNVQGTSQLFSQDVMLYSQGHWTVLLWTEQTSKESVFPLCYSEHGSGLSWLVWNIVSSKTHSEWISLLLELIHVWLQSREELLHRVAVQHPSRMAYSTYGLCPVFIDHVITQRHIVSSLACWACACVATQWKIFSPKQPFHSKQLCVVWFFDLCS